MKTVQVGQHFYRWINLLRISIGLIYVWFGALKFFPGISPAEDLAKETIKLLSFGFIPGNISIIMLAVWETTAGIAMIFNFYPRIITSVLLVHMFCTFTPLFLIPELSFTHAPYAFTLVGQYIVKNIVIVCALLFIKEHYSVSR